MTLYGYARVSVREPEDKNLDLQVERLVRAGCSLGNIRAEEASGARNDRGGLLELLDLVVEGDTLVVTHIDRLSRGLTYGLQVIEGLHRMREWSSVPCRRTSTRPRPTASSSSRWCLPSASGGGIRSGSARSQAKPRRGPRAVSLGRTAQPDPTAAGIHQGGAVEGSEPAATGQAPGGQPLDHPTGERIAVEWELQSSLESRA